MSVPERQGCGGKAAPLRRQRGVAAVEFALVAVLFFTLVCGVLEAARAMYLFNTLQEVSRRAAAIASNAAFDPGSVDAIRRQALFKNVYGNLILGEPITPDHLRIDYLSVSRDAGTGALSTQRVVSLPACPEQNVLNCTTDPYGASCIRMVQVRVCQPGGSDCTPVPYQSILPFIDLSTIALPTATSIVPAQTLGNRPGTLPCP